jgi:hypothetical protein
VAYSKIAIEMWTFLCYLLLNESGLVDIIDEWYRGQSGEVQGEVDAVVESLKIIPRKFWRRPAYRALHGNWDGLHAIAIRAGEEQYRIVGFFGPAADGEFTLLVPFKKGDDPDYAQSCPKAQARMAMALQDRDRTHECF